MDDKNKLVFFNLKLPLYLRSYYKIRAEQLGVTVNDLMVMCLNSGRKNKINLQESEKDI